MRPEDVLDASKLCYDGDFNMQIENLLQTVRLTRDQVESLKTLIDDLVWQLRYVWPDCTAMCFGSIVIGLGIKTSDLDCYIDTHNDQPPKECVLLARNVIKHYPNLFRKIFAIKAAKVPIVKFLHVPTNFNCDISFSGPTGVLNSKLMAYLLQFDNRSIRLATLVKYWSKVYDFTGTNLMPNYALTILVIFYLQLKGLIPSIYDLQKNIESDMVNHWNTAFNERWRQPQKSKESLYELLGGFFKYYSKFNFAEDMVSPFLGQRLKRKAFTKSANVPNEFELYKYNVDNRICKALRMDTFMCIQDTIEHNRNCTVAVYPRLALRILAHFKFAADLYDRVDSREFLKSLLTEDPTPTSTTVADHTGKIRKIPKNNKGLFKKKFKDLFKTSKLDVNSFQKTKR